MLARLLCLARFYFKLALTICSIRTYQSIQTSYIIISNAFPIHSFYLHVIFQYNINIEVLRKQMSLYVYNDYGSLRNAIDQHVNLYWG